MLHSANWLSTATLGKPLKTPYEIVLYVHGLRQESTQRRLLAETDLTYSKAIEMAKGMETAAKEARTLRDTDHNAPVVKKLTATARMGTAWPRHRVTAVDERIIGQTNASLGTQPVTRVARLAISHQFVEANRKQPMGSQVQHGSTGPRNTPKRTRSTTLRNYRAAVMEVIMNFIYTVWESQPLRIRSSYP